MLRFLFVDIFFLRLVIILVVFFVEEILNIVERKNSCKY